MTKKLIGIIFVILTVIIVAVLLVVVVHRYTEPDVISPTNEIEVAQEVESIRYTHPTGDYSFNYPETWEFLPERPDLGMRPKAYCCSEFNEIVTILYFDLDGKDFETLTSEFDGVSSTNWTEFTTTSGETGYSYTHSSNKLGYVTNWFHNGDHALKMMFRFSDVYATDGNTDNTQYLNDFEGMLNSLTFN